MSNFKLQNPGTTYSQVQFSDHNGNALLTWFSLDNDGYQVKRYRKRINRYLKGVANNKERNLIVARLISELNESLAVSTPIDHSEPGSLCSCVDLFLSEKSREVRPDTYRSYSSFCGQIKAYFRRFPSITVKEIDKAKAVQYMDYIYHRKDVSPRTFNNHLKFCRCLFSWFQDHTLIDHNYFVDIKSKRTFPKRRTLIQVDDISRIWEYLECDIELRLYLKLIYISLIRPKECRMLRIGNIHLFDCYIQVPGEIAKNHQDRRSIINESVVNDLVLYKNLNKARTVDLLFDGHSHQYFLRRWVKVKEALNLPDTYQIYSFRDTGITTYLKNGVNPATVMQLAGHSNLMITSIYAKHIDTTIYKELQKKTPV